MMKNALLNRFTAWHDKLTEYRHKMYISLFEERGASLLSLGCAEGKLTFNISRKVETDTVVGIDMYAELQGLYKEKIKLIRSDLNTGIPLQDRSVDIISGDQIIEHLFNTDVFVKEIYRVLKPGGYAVICTENLASLHNLFALFFGKQAFSQFISSRYRLGNPFSPHYKKPVKDGHFHVQIFTVQGLKDICEIYNLKVEKIKGIIYFPFLPFWSGKLFEKIFPAHAHFIAVRARKLK